MIFLTLTPMNKSVKFGLKEKKTILFIYYYYPFLEKKKKKD